MAIQVLRIETRDRLDSKLLRHCLGESRPAHARSNRSNVVLLDGSKKAKARLAEFASRKRGRGRPPKQCVDMLFAGPPAYAPNPKWDKERLRQWDIDSTLWSETRTLEWANDTVDWVKQLFPESPIAAAVLHRDESSPHLHVLMIPEIEDRLSWKACKERAVGSRAYRRLQDSYHKHVAKEYGLGRGERGSRRKHKPPTLKEGIERAEREFEYGRKMQAKSRAEIEVAKTITGSSYYVERGIRKAADDPFLKMERELKKIEEKNKEERERLRTEQWKALHAQKQEHEKALRQRLAEHKREVAALNQKVAAKKEEARREEEEIQTKTERLERLMQKKPGWFSKPLASAGGG